MNNDMTLNALHVASNNTFLMMILICNSLNEYVSAK